MFTDTMNRKSFLLKYPQDLTSVEIYQMPTNVWHSWFHVTSNFIFMTLNRGANVQVDKYEINKISELFTEISSSGGPVPS